MNKADRTKHNAAMVENVMRNKRNAIRIAGKMTGKKWKSITVASIINPTTKTADIFIIPGFHKVLNWNSKLVKESYSGTYFYT